MKTVHIPVELHRKLKVMAFESGVTITGLLVELLGGVMGLDRPAQRPSPGPDHPPDASNLVRS